jgi:hypothetical protein
VRCCRSAPKELRLTVAEPPVHRLVVEMEWESAAIGASTSRRKFKLFRLVDNDSVKVRGERTRRYTADVPVPVSEYRSVSQLHPQQDPAQALVGQG